MYSTTLEFTAICDRKFLVTSLNSFNHDLRNGEVLGFL
jgi:hypothetical protein